MQLRHAAKHAPLPEHAALAGQGTARSWKEAVAWKTWAWVSAHPAVYRALVRIARQLRGLTPGWQGGWTSSRRPLKLAKRGLRDRLNDH